MCHRDSGISSETVVSDDSDRDSGPCVIETVVSALRQWS